MNETNPLRQRKPLSGGGQRRKGRQKSEECEKTGESSLKWILVAVLAGGLWVILILPSPIEPEAFELPPPPKFEDELKPNERLHEATRMMENKIRGPESIAIRNGKLYTGTADGKVVSIDLETNTMKTVARLGNAPCGLPDDEPTCGRPLGLRFDKDGTLVIVDAYLGLFRINVDTGAFKCLLSSSQAIKGEKPKLLNDVDIADDGKIYFTDSSSKWNRKDNRLLIMDAPTDARVMVFDPKTGETEVIIDHLMFANGIQLSENNDYLLVVELTKCRILKYHLRGLQARQLEVFADNLPGVPDNIRRRPNGHYWVSMATIRRQEKFSFIDFTAPRPWFKKILMKIFDQETLVKISPKYGLIIELNKNGQIVKSFHDPSGEIVPSISQAEEHNGVLYLGSYYLPYISKLVLTESELPYVENQT